MRDRQPATSPLTERASPLSVEPQGGIQGRRGSIETRRTNRTVLADVGLPRTLDHWRAASRSKPSVAVTPRYSVTFRTCTDGNAIGLEKDYKLVKGHGRDGFENWLTDLLEKALGLRRRSDVSALDHWEFALGIAVVAALFLSAVALDVRGRIAEEVERDPGWYRRDRIAQMSVVWAAVCLPGLMGFSAILPLNDAKVCATAGLSDEGVLIGQTGDRVYLGQKYNPNPRISAFPMAQVEQLFIGPLSSEAPCDARGPQSAITASAQADIAREFAEMAQRAAARVAGDPGRAVAATREAGEAAIRAGNAASFGAATAAHNLDPISAEEADFAGDRSYEAGTKALAIADETAPSHVALERAARTAAKAAVAAAEAAQVAAEKALSQAKASSE